MPDVSVNADLSQLAPGFLVRVRAVLDDLRASGLDPRVFEGVRTPARQAYLYAQGRTRPGKIVTRARTSLLSWHGHGLAVDIISTSLLWGAPKTFWAALGAACRDHGLDWGGDWTTPDLPHCQFGACPASPTKADQERTKTEGMAATWAAYGAV